MESIQVFFDELDDDLIRDGARKDAGEGTKKMTESRQ